MSAEDNLSQELFFNVHRGVNVSYPHYPEAGGKSQYALDQENLGTHWSVDEPVAKDFANHPSSRSKYPSWRTNHGRVIHAEIPMSAVETDTETMRGKGFANFDGKDEFKEKEVMAKKGAPIRVTGITKLRESKDKGRVQSRKRTYNPPREMNV